MIAFGIWGVGVAHKVRTEVGKKVLLSLYTSALGFESLFLETAILHRKEAHELTPQQIKCRNTTKGNDLVVGDIQSEW